jgi:hypothetical protein
MGGADVDYMGVTSNAMVQMIEANRNGRLAFSEQRLQLSHSNCVALSIVEREVADLRKCEHVSK